MLIPDVRLWNAFLKSVIAATITDTMSDTIIKTYCSSSWHVHVVKNYILKYLQQGITCTEPPCLAHMNPIWRDTVTELFLVPNTWLKYLRLDIFQSCKVVTYTCYKWHFNIFIACIIGNPMRRGIDTIINSIQHHWHSHWYCWYLMLACESVS